MKAYEILGPFNGQIIDVDKPSINNGEVLIKVQYVSLCGSDRHLYKGELPNQVYPIIPGHEFCGVISEANKKDIHLIGKKAISDVMFDCGMCQSCKEGRQCTCPKELGFKINGALSEFIKVPVNKIYLLPHDYDMQVACLIEPTAVALHTITELNIKDDSNVIIYGCGSIGICIVNAMVHKGIKDITIVDINDKKLSFVRDHFKIRTSQHLINDAEIIIDTTGSKEVITNIIDNAKYGTKIGILGFSNESIKIDSSKLLLNGLTIKGIISPKNVWKEAIELLKRNTDIKRMFTHMYDLLHTNEAFAKLTSNDSHFIKSIIEIR